MMVISSQPWTDIERHSFATLLVAYFQIFNKDMVKKNLCSFEIALIMLTSAGLQLYCFFPWTNIRGTVHFIFLVGESWHKFVPTGQTITFMDSFKATYVLENIDKKLGLCGWTKYQLFPKSEMIVPPQVLAMLLLPDNWQVPDTWRNAFTCQLWPKLWKVQTLLRHLT